MIDAAWFARLLAAAASDGAAAFARARAELQASAGAEAAAAVRFLDEHGARLAALPVPMLLSLAASQPAASAVGAAFRAWDATSAGHPAFLRPRGAAVASDDAGPAFSLAPGDTRGDANDIAVDARGELVLVGLQGHHGRIFPTDSGVLAWSLPDRRLVAALPGDPAWLNAVAIAPDGTWGVSVGRRRKPIVYDLAAGTATTLSKAQRSEVACVAILPDGERFATGSHDGTIRMWHRSGQVLSTFDAHDAWVYDLAVSPDGRTLVSVGWDGTVRVWDLAGTELARWSTKSHPWRVLVGPDGTIFHDDGDGTVLRRDPTGRELARFPECGSTFALDREGRRLAAGGEDGTAVWDVEGTRVIGRIPGGHVAAVAFAGDTILFVNQFDPTLYGHDLRRLAPAEASARAELPGIGFIVTDPTATWAISAERSSGLLGLEQSEVGARTHSPQGTLRVHALADGHAVGELAGSAGPFGFLSDGRAWTSGEGGALVLWDLASCARRWEVPAFFTETRRSEGRTAGSAFPDGSSAAFTRGVEGGEAVEILDLASGRALLRAATVKRVRALVAVGPVGEREASVVWMSRGALHRSFVSGGGWSTDLSGVPHGLRVDPARDRVFAAIGAGIGVWSLETGALVRTLSGRSKANIYAVELLPDGDVVSGGEDGAARRWNPTTGKERWKAKPVSKWLRVVDADRDGRVLRVIGGMFDELLLDARTGARCGAPSRNCGFYEGHAGVLRYAIGSYEADVHVLRTDGPEALRWIAPWKGTLAVVAADGAVVVAGPRGDMIVLDVVPAR